MYDYSALSRDDTLVEIPTGESSRTNDDADKLAKQDQVSLRPAPAYNNSNIPESGRGGQAHLCQSMPS